MASDLYWKPSHFLGVAILPRSIKYAICPKYWDHDGSLGGEMKTFTLEDIPDLESIRDAGHPDVEILIKIIKEYVSIQLWFEV